MAEIPTDRDREYLQSELTRMVGIGRINLEVFQQAVDTVLAAEDISVLAEIHARYIGTPPAEWGALPAPISQPQMPQLQPQREFSSTMGTIKRTGNWLVPEHCTFKLNAATLHLDLREATAAAQLITFELRATAADITIIVPPGVHVHNQLKETWSDSKFNVTAPSPGAPQVFLTGFVRGSTLVVDTRAPGKNSLWNKIWGS
ncbi:DUF1707 domain-containing protein [Corynebacterium sp. A21]|uniref:DUF1707 domain-containing protein n=1 Tax=Corynebacterium sp. A21 TaxID=3457318 RepID=UPI003FD2FC5E